MLLECKNCGAPLDVGNQINAKCGYCKASSVVKTMRSLAMQTPPGWQPPPQWTPPAHVPADSNQVLTYTRVKQPRAPRPGGSHGPQGTSKGGAVVMIALAVALMGISGAAFFILGRAGNSTQTIVGGNCPSNASGVTGSRSCDCISGRIGGSVWGTDIYTADSSVCKAAAHAGVIPSTGGKVTFVTTNGCPSYTGSSRNGVETRGWGSFQKSFYFPAQGNGQCGGGSVGASVGNPVGALPTAGAAAPVPTARIGAPCPATFADVTMPPNLSMFVCRCEPAGAVSGSAWGTDVYTADSNICKAAKHAGAGTGTGMVVLKPAAGCKSYQGTDRNGVSSSGWGKFDQSFYFVGKGLGTCPD